MKVIRYFYFLLMIFYESLVSFFVYMYFIMTKMQGSLPEH